MARSLPRQPLGDPSQSASEELPSLAFSTHLFKFSLCHPSVCSHHYVTPGWEKAAVALTMPLSPSLSLSYVTVLCCYLTISATAGFPSWTGYFPTCSRFLNDVSLSVFFHLFNIAVISIRKKNVFLGRVGGVLKFYLTKYLHVCAAGFSRGLKRVYGGCC